MESYIDQLELYIEPTKLNKEFKSLNDTDKNIVIELGMKLLSKGCKDYQMLKNEEWSEKLVSLEQEKNEKISSLYEEIDRKKQAMKKCKENHREELSTIKNQIEEQVKCIYKSEIETLKEKVELTNRELENERKNKWTMQQTLHDNMDEKICKIRNDEEMKRKKLRQTYDDLLNKEREKCMDFCKRQDNSTLVGQDGDQFTYHNLNIMFPKSEVIDTHDTKNSGDFKLIYNSMPLMLEVKNYSNNVLKKEIVKFKRDISYQKDMKGGIFISLKSFKSLSQISFCKQK